MQSEKQYIDLYNEAQEMIKQHSCAVLNKVRDKAFEDFKTQGFPTNCLLYTSDAADDSTEV